MEQTDISTLQHFLDILMHDLDYTTTRNDTHEYAFMCLCFISGSLVIIYINMSAQVVLFMFLCCGNAPMPSTKAQAKDLTVTQIGVDHSSAIFDLSKLEQCLAQDMHTILKGML